MGALDYAKKAINLLTPDAQAEKLVFRKFPGDALAKAAVNKGKVEAKQIETVILKVNPKSIQFQKRKVIQKVQTSAPGRFIVFDWGHELTMLTIEGVTGNLLPESITRGVGDPLSGALIEAVSWAPGGQQALTQNATWKGAQAVGSEINSMFNNALFGNLAYSELLELSTKYKTFKKLEQMYKNADADDDIIILEIGPSIYRGFFEEFGFAVTSDSPWNWAYTIVFVILSEISEFAAQHDPRFKELETKTTKS